MQGWKDTRKASCAPGQQCLLEAEGRVASDSRRFMHQLERRRNGTPKLLCILPHQKDADCASRPQNELNQPTSDPQTPESRARPRSNLRAPCSKKHHCQSPSPLLPSSLPMTTQRSSIIRDSCVSLSKHLLPSREHTFQLTFALVAAMVLWLFTNHAWTRYRWNCKLRQ